MGLGFRVYGGLIVILGSHWGYTGIMENEMETTISG